MSGNATDYDAWIAAADPKNPATILAKLMFVDRAPTKTEMENIKAMYNEAAAQTF